MRTYLELFLVHCHIGRRVVCYLRLLLPLHPFIERRGQKLLLFFTFIIARPWAICTSTSSCVGRSVGEWSGFTLPRFFCTPIGESAGACARGRIIVGRDGSACFMLTLRTLRLDNGFSPLSSNSRVADLQHDFFTSNPIAVNNSQLSAVAAIYRRVVPYLTWNITY